MLITSIIGLIVFATLFKNLRGIWYVLHAGLVVAASWYWEQSHPLPMFDKQAIAYFLLIHFVTVNLVILLMYGVDKLAAKREAWRIPERVFHAFTFVGGTVGALVGQKLFNHKRAKIYRFVQGKNVGRLLATISFRPGANRGD